MFKRILVLTLALLFCTQFLYAQKDDGQSFGISFKGFVKTDMMFDSRQTVNAREGHFLLYPANEAFDASGDDINAASNLNMLSIQTRLTGNITGPDAFGAKTSGVVEAAFFGHSNGDINGLRLRHAFVKLDWKESSLLVGQYWHPMFATDVYAGVISFNTGVPFQPFSRNPQIRYTHKFDAVHLTLTAASQRDFPSYGPDNNPSTPPKKSSSDFLRNAVVPILNGSLKYVSPTFVVGAGVNYMSLRPELVTATNNITEEKISSMSFVGFAKVKAGDLAVKLEGVMGQNMFDLLMIGGYAVKAVDPETGASEYTNIKTTSVWTDISYGKAFQVALFGGYCMNGGAEDEIVGAYYSRGSNIASVLRVSPRVQYTMGKVRFAAEVEHTIAEYGTPNAEGVVEEWTDANDVTHAVEAISNTRVLLSAYLFF